MEFPSNVKVFFFFFLIALDNCQIAFPCDCVNIHKEVCEVFIFPYSYNQCSQTFKLGSV